MNTSEFIMGKKFLIVDDEEDLRELIVDEIESLGGKCTEADGSQGAWSLILKNQYDCIISDVRMPKGSGIDLLKKVRSHCDYSHLPIIIMTGYTIYSKEDIQSLDPSAIMDKPFSFEKLLQTISQSFS